MRSPILAGNATDPFAMPLEKNPYELIQDMVANRKHWSDADVIAEMEQLPPLADENDPAWDDERYWNEFAYRYVALSEVAAERRLRPAVRLLLERACNGDPGEIMRGLRHAFERIFSPDWPALADVCIALSVSERPGTRLWAIVQLTILDNPEVRETFENALNDEIVRIRELGAIGLQRLDCIAR